MQTYTIFDFNRDFHVETLNELGFHYWPIIPFCIIGIIAAILLLISPEIAFILTVSLVAPIGLFQLYKYNDVYEFIQIDRTHPPYQQYDEHRNEKVRAAYLKHQEEIDTGINESLAKHDLTHDEVCNHSTVLDDNEREPVDASETLLCGTDGGNALPGMFILDNRDAVVRAGEYEGEIVVVYKPENDPATNT